MTDERKLEIAIEKILVDWACRDSKNDLVEVRRQIIDLFKPKAELHCIGYPNCDGNLPGEPHSIGCPKQEREPASQDREIEALRLDAERLYDAIRSTVHARLMEAVAAHEKLVGDSR